MLSRAFQSVLADAELIEEVKALSAIVGEAGLSALADEALAAGLELPGALAETLASPDRVSEILENLLAGMETADSDIAEAIVCILVGRRFWPAMASSTGRSRKFGESACVTPRGK